MSNLVLPSLPGADIKITREPIWEVNIQKTLSGKEIRSTYWTYPRYRYTLDFNFLRTTATYPEYQTFLGFVSRHASSWDSFLFQDPDDYTQTAEYFGKGNGATTAFQLQRTLVADADIPAAASRLYWPNPTNGYEPIFEFNGTPTIYVNGTPTSPASIVNGLVTFGSPPANNALLSFTGSYYYRVRFDDVIQATRVLSYFYEAKSIKLITVKP